MEIIKNQMFLKIIKDSNILWHLGSKILDWNFFISEIFWIDEAENQGYFSRKYTLFEVFIEKIVSTITMNFTNVYL